MKCGLHFKGMNFCLNYIMVDWGFMYFWGFFFFLVCAKW